jgi:hypothetical protein
MLTRMGRGVCVSAAIIASAYVFALPLLADTPTTVKGLPVRLSDQDFWRLSSELSEPDGTFRSDNLVSFRAFGPARGCRSRRETRQAAIDD